MNVKRATSTSNGHNQWLPSKRGRPRMTRRLAEKRAVGDSKAPKFDGVAFLRSLRT